MFKRHVHNVAVMVVCLGAGCLPTPTETTGGDAGPGGTGSSATPSGGVTSGGASTSSSSGGVSGSVAFSTGGSSSSGSSSGTSASMTGSSVGATSSTSVSSATSGVSGSSSTLPVFSGGTSRPSGVSSSLGATGSSVAGAPSSSAVTTGSSSVGGTSSSGVVVSSSQGCATQPEVCNGLDDNCDGVADNGLSGCDPCAPHHELPVVTHWSNQANAPQFLAVDTPVVTQAYPATPYAAGTCYPYYTQNRYPTLDNYVGDTWSVTGISNTEAVSVLGSVCQATGVPVRLLRPDAVNSRLLSRPGAVQVVHAVVVDGSLITVVLPANWDAAAPAGRYPIVANGFYDLNDNVFHQEGPTLLRMVALSSTNGRTGAIGVLWNGGGALASRTMNPRALQQFSAVMAYVASEFGGDPHRVLMFGGSRGGQTALAMASNPQGNNYTVRYVAAGVPPTRIGEHATWQSTTFPGVMQAVGWTTGMQDAWRNGWTYPACAGHPALTGLTGPAAHLAILTGNSDPAVVDAQLSIGSPPYIAGLLAAGTQVYLESGTHDFIVPFAHQVQYGLDLIAAGVPLQVDVLVRAGHAQRSEGGTLGGVRVNRIWDALQAYVDPARAGQTPQVTPGLAFYRVNRANGALEPFVPDGGLFPFTLEAPRYSVPGLRFPMVLVGAPGTAWEVTLTGVGGPELYVWTGTLDAYARSVVWVDVPANQRLGDYRYTARIQKPGSATWQDITATQTVDGSDALLTVVDQEPNVGADEIMTLSSGPRVMGYGGTNWGLSEY